MKNVLDFIINNYEWLSAVIYELIVRITPTSKNLSLIDNALKFIGWIIKNRRKPQTTDEVHPVTDSEGGITGTIKQKNKVWVDRTKHIIPVILLLCSFTALAQNNSAFKAAFSYNADSATVRAVTDNLNDTYSGLAGALYYNTDGVNPKWRIWQDTAWFDLVNTGSGNISGTLSAPGVPYTSADNTLATDENWFTYDATSHLLTSGYLQLDPDPDGSEGASLNLGAMSTDPATASPADLWYNSTDQALRYARSGGTDVSIFGTVSPLGATQIPYLSTTSSQLFSGETTFTYNASVDRLSVPNLLLTPQGADPVGPSAGYMWYNSSDNQLKAFINGSTVALGGAGLQTASEGLTAVGSDVQFGGTLTGGTLKQVTSTVGNGVAFSMSSGTPEFSYLTVTPNFVNMQHREPTGVITYKYELNDTGGTFEGDHVFMQGASTALSIKDVSGVIQIVMPNLPTSAAGLPSGCLWNNAGVLSVAP